MILFIHIMYKQHSTANNKFEVQIISISKMDILSLLNALSFVEDYIVHQAIDKSKRSILKNHEKILHQN